MIQVKLRVSIGSTELAESGVLGDFICLYDSSRGNYISLCYDLDNEQMKLYESDTGNEVVAPITLVADQEAVFVLNINALSGYSKVNFYMNGAFFGELITQQLLMPNKLMAGVVHAPAGVTVNRKIRNLTAGSSAGATDLFNDGGYGNGTIVPPFEGMQGVGLSISSGALHVSNSGVDAYGIKIISVQSQPPAGLDPFLLQLLGL